MSNRYWIDRRRHRDRGGRRRNVHRADDGSARTCRRSNRARSCPRRRPLRPSSWWTRRARPPRPRPCAGHPTLVFFGFTHCPDVCPTTLALLADVQKQVALPTGDWLVSRWRSSRVDPERDTPAQLGNYIASFGGDLIGLTGSAPDNCERLAELRRGGEPRRSAAAATTPWTTRPPCSRSTPTRASSRSSRRRCARPRSTRDLARLADTSCGGRAAAAMTRRSRRHGPRVRRAPAPAASARHLAPGAGGDAFALASVQERAHPPVRARLPSRHVGRGGTRAHRLRELQRILHARAAPGHAPRGCRHARDRLAGRRHGERGRRRSPRIACCRPRATTTRCARCSPATRPGNARSPAARSRLSTSRPTTITASTWRSMASCARASTCRGACSA